MGAGTDGRALHLESEMHKAHVPISMLPPAIMMITFMIKSVYFAMRPSTNNVCRWTAIVLKMIQSLQLVEEASLDRKPFSELA
jgi:hypothetical protein